MVNKENKIASNWAVKNVHWSNPAVTTLIHLLTMVYPRVLPLLTAIIVIIAMLRDLWNTVEEVDLAAVAGDNENQKLQLQAVLWRLDQLEKHIFFKDDPSKSSVLASHKMVFRRPEAEWDQPSDTNKIVNAEPTNEMEFRTSDTAVTTGLEAELKKVKRAVQVFAQRKSLYIFMYHTKSFHSLAFSNGPA